MSRLSWHVSVSVGGCIDYANCSSPLEGGTFHAWVVNCVNTERGLDTRKHACINSLLSALDCGCNVTSYPLTGTGIVSQISPFSHNPLSGLTAAIGKEAGNLLGMSFPALLPKACRVRSHGTRPINLALNKLSMPAKVGDPRKQVPGEMRQ